MTEILLNVLKQTQDKHGYISEKALKQISISYNVPLSRLYGMVKFYTMLRTEPQGKYVIEICGSPSCVLNNGTKLQTFLEKDLKLKIGETTKDKIFTLYKTSCLGLCNEAPAILINEKPYTKLTVNKLRDILKQLRKESKTTKRKK